MDITSPWTDILAWDSVSWAKRADICWNSHSFSSHVGCGAIMGQWTGGYSAAKLSPVEDEGTFQRRSPLNHPFADIVGLPMTFTCFKTNQACQLPGGTEPGCNLGITFPQDLTKLAQHYAIQPNSSTGRFSRIKNRPVKHVHPSRYKAWNCQLPTSDHFMPLLMSGLRFHRGSHAWCS